MGRTYTPSSFAAACVIPLLLSQPQCSTYYCSSPRASARTWTHAMPAHIPLIRMPYRHIFHSYTCRTGTYSTYSHAIPVCFPLIRMSYQHTSHSYTCHTGTRPTHMHVIPTYMPLLHTPYRRMPAYIPVIRMPCRHGILLMHMPSGTQFTYIHLWQNTSIILTLYAPKVNTVCGHIRQMPLQPLMLRLYQVGIVPKQLLHRVCGKL